MEELKKELAEVKALIEYQGKMIEEIYQNMDEASKKKAAIMPNIEAMMGIVSAHPAIKNNPAMMDMFRNLTSSMGGANGG